MWSLVDASLCCDGHFRVRNHGQASCLSKNVLCSNNQPHLYFLHLISLCFVSLFPHAANKCAGNCISSFFNTLVYLFFLFLSELTKAYVNSSSWMSWLFHCDQFNSPSFSFLISCSGTYQFLSTDLLEILTFDWLYVVCQDLKNKNNF